MRKMNFIKRVRIKETVDVDRRSLSRAKRKTINYSNVTELALHLVESVINAAVTFVEEAKNPIKNIKWITHGEFTAERGCKEIERFILAELTIPITRAIKYIVKRGDMKPYLPLGLFALEHVSRHAVPRNWEYQDRWVHYTEFIQREDWIHSFHYIYCVQWSPASARRPVPRVSASAFFTIKITKNKPPDTPVDVSYIFEGHSLVQRPGMIRFRENWLREIIESKHILLESVPF